MTGRQHRAFVKLLVSLFEVEELRFFVRGLERGQDVLEAVSKRLPKVQHASEILVALDHRGMVNEALIQALIAERPYRASDIQELWVALSFSSAGGPSTHPDLRPDSVEHMSSSDSAPSETSDDGHRFERRVSLVVGSMIVCTVLILALRNQPINDPNVVVLLRIVVAVAVGIVGATIPGFLRIKRDGHGWSIRAGGALILAVLSMVITPKVSYGPGPAEPNPDLIAKSVEAALTKRSITKQLGDLRTASASERAEIVDRLAGDKTTRDQLETFLAHQILAGEGREVCALLLAAHRYLQNNIEPGRVSELLSKVKGEAEYLLSGITCTPDLRPHFQRGVFDRLSFERAELSEVNFTRSRFSEVTFRADPDYAKGRTDCAIREANFIASSIELSSFSACDLIDVDFNSSKLSRVNFHRCRLSDVRFTFADLSGVRFLGGHLVNVDFRLIKGQPPLFAMDASGTGIRLELGAAEHVASTEIGWPARFAPAVCIDTSRAAECWDRAPSAPTSCAELAQPRTFIVFPEGRSKDCESLIARINGT